MLAEKLAVTDGLLYRRGNFNGSWDQLVCDALMEVQDAPIAFSPGFRWGTTLLPGEAITRELMMDQLATTYSYATVTEMSGEMIKTILEDVADNLFNPDPTTSRAATWCASAASPMRSSPARRWARISDMRWNGTAIDLQDLQGAGWAPVAEEAKTAGNKPVWDVVEQWLKAKGRVAPRRINTPRLIGVQR